ncbi:MAG: arginine--tRNA ligase [Anaerolineae bacterium]|nr:MAG: arginine--tRNA ligase [Anaerolineae bacterium]
MFERERQAIETQLKAYLAEQGVPFTEDFKWSNIPFSGEWGIATSFFQAAAAEARAGKKVVVPVRAQELADGAARAIGLPDGFSRVEAVKGYLNLYFNTATYSQRVVDTVLAAGDEFGRGAPKGKRIMVEFSQPNTHKAMHVGHLRNMMLGAALANILEFAGWDVVRANYIGDFGKDVLKWVWNFRKRHAGERPPAEDVTRWMGDLYAESTTNLENDPDGDKEIEDLFHRWEAGDEEVVGLWRETRQWSLDGFSQVYDLMGIHFDRIYFESECEKPGKEYVEELVKRGIAIDERPAGPVIVKIDDLLGLEKEDYRVLVILRSDDTALYATWDLVLAQRKFKDYPDLETSLYVVDVRQSQHFRQVFKVLELAGVDEIKKAAHLPYEIVNLPGNITMSSREGTVVLLEDFIREAVSRARQVSEESNPELDAKTRDEVAWAVGLGSIKYPLIARDHSKIATFDWESALDFNGQASPYIQYAHVRANSILRKAGGAVPAPVAPTHLLDPKEVALIELLADFPAAVQRAADEWRTLQITNHAFELAKAFSEFYNACPVLNAEPAVRDFRLRLVAAARPALANALRLLGIQAPPVM